MKEFSPEEKEREFNEFIVREYLRYGSVDEVFRANNYSLPISYPSVQRLLDRWGIVKAAGPNTVLSECLSFMVRLAEEQVPLEALYKRMPPSFTPSLSTLHRIYRTVKKEVKNKIEERKMRRKGAALVITASDNPYRLLIGNDVSTPRLDVGKPYGSISLPMGFSKVKEDDSLSVLRVLQQEVFTELAVKRSISEELYKDINPFMFIDIADVRVSVYHVKLPESLSGEDSFTSYKLKNHQFINLNSLISEDVSLKRFRQGVVEISEGFERYLSEDLSESFYVTSSLNMRLALLPVDY